MIKFESWGVFLSGSRKNQRVKRVSKKPMAQRGIQSINAASEIAKKIAANFHPSG